MRRFRARGPRLPDTIYSGSMLRLLVFLALFAAVVYATFWLIDRRSKGGGDGTSRPIPRGPLGPDDDDEFLRELERKKRHSKDEES
jgi:hypothetical protein